jgi:NAD(H)-dependent 7beta-hydroxy-3-oxo-delta4-cholenoic acid oxidoreductase
MKPLNKLFSPISIGSMGLKNRIVMAPMNSRLGNEDGTVSQRLIDYYEARAKGGAGLIILPSISVDRISPFKNNLVLWDDKFIPSFRDVTEAVHAHGTKVAPQLCHPAPGMRPLSSLNLQDMRRMTGQFGDAARRAREAGCDGIELHAAHARLLLGSSISALCNRRTDAYGGSIEGRLRLLIEVIEHIRQKVGRDFPIMIRISGDELVPGGRNIRETQYIAPILAEVGIDAFDMSVGVFGHPLMGGTAGAGSPEGVTVPYSKAVKEVVDVPVIAVGRINNPRYAEDIVRRDEADMVALGRALIADPEWPKKAAEGRFDDIAPCVGCLLGCGFGREGPITCLVNPAVGRESEMVISPAPRRKKILVVGGGPGGLEAARVSALRGHDVTLCDKEAMPGGQLNWASIAPMKQEFTRVIQYLWTQAEKAGVHVQLNKEVTPRFIEENRPDVVIVATGIEPFVPDIPGVKGERIVTAYDVLAGKAAIRPGEVMIVGGGMVGCEVADFLADFGDSRPGSCVAVTIIEMMKEVCLDVSGDVRASLLERLREKGVKILTSAKVIEFLEDGILFTRDGREETVRGADSIILAMGAISADRLSAGIRHNIAEVYVIGDAKEPRRALEAVAEGAEVGRHI